jgi:hypothetical protein
MDESMHGQYRTVVKIDQTGIASVWASSMTEYREAKLLGKR